MKISHFEQIITPEIGTCIAGYYAHDESTEILDDLKLSILLMDDGGKTGAPWREECPAFIIFVEQKANVMPAVLEYYKDKIHLASCL